VLTTHYLEEAESLCGRIAMLKQGRVIALERTADLLSRPVQQTLRFRLRGQSALPPKFLPEARALPDGRLSIALADADAVAACLGSLHEAGVGLEDIEVVRPDLEDVFIAMMREVA
jgi:ABC-2 type transport system ATP-binding protein